MQTQMQIFEHQDFGKVRTVIIDGQPWFIGKDITDILGYTNPRKALGDHVEDEDKLAYRFVTSGQNRTMTAINESGLYSLILSSKLPAAKAFKRWVTSEILPSIRKHGAYITDETLRKMQEDSGYTAELLKTLEDERKQKEALHNYVEKIAPKARYYDAVLQCPDGVQISIIAKEYGMSAVKFNKLLHALGVQHKVGKTWLLYADHTGKGYTVSKTICAGGESVSILTCFTQRGRVWLYELLKSHGILPISERPAEK